MVVPRKKHQKFDVLHVDVTGSNNFLVHRTMDVNVGIKFVIKAPVQNNIFV